MPIYAVGNEMEYECGCVVLDAIYKCGKNSYGGLLSLFSRRPMSLLIYSPLTHKYFKICVVCVLVFVRILLVSHDLKVECK